MHNVLIVPNMTDSKSIQPIGPRKPTLIEQAGQAANKAASAGVFDDYRERRAENTLRAHDASLQRFTDFLTGVGAPPDAELCCDPAAWRGITWGLVEAFKRWMLDEGFAIASVNLALSNIKVYAKLASKAGSLDKIEYLQIKDVTGYSRKEAKRVDEAREQTRRSAPGQPHKKAVHTHVPADDARRLKRNYPDTPQGRRDAVMMGLLLDLGLRVGEVAGITVGNVNLQSGQITFYRPKVDKKQTHDMPGDLLRVMKAYFNFGDAPVMKDELLLRSSKKNGELSTAGMSERSISARVRLLGKQLGLERLSPHDCRHHWATAHARKGVDPFRLQEAGGWSSLTMPRRYVDEAKIANEGMGSV